MDNVKINEEEHDYDNYKFSFSRLLKLFCCPPLPSSIGNKIAFLRLPPTYFITIDPNSHELTFNLKASSGWELTNKDKNYLKFGYFYSQSGNKLASVFINIFSNSKYTILFSHGNAVDIGNSCGYLLELAMRLQVNIFCYDYSGYGVSEGIATEKNVCLDIRAACDYLNSFYNVQTSSIILYGQSIGTVPTVDIATERYFAGIILHSSLASGLKVVFPNLGKNLWCDVFKSSSKISKVMSPTLIIHGKKDEIVPFSHGTTLYDLAANPVAPLWVNGAGHNDIEYFPEYYIRLKKFLSEDLIGISSKYRASSLKTTTSVSNC